MGIGTESCLSLLEIVLIFCITSANINHKSATNYPEQVDTYLKDEIKNNAMLGNVHVSPLMTHEKSNSVSRRLLSWPIRESANSGETPDKYLGTEFILTFPSVDNFVDEELKLGKG